VAEPIITKKPVIIIDSREQVPYVFPEHNVLRRKLDAGDYSVACLEKEISVERKSVADFIGTITKRRKNFYAEMRRLKEYERACVVVEGSITDVYKGRYRSMMTPSAAIGTTMSIIVDCGIPIFFCDSRQIARDFTERYLMRFWKYKQFSNEELGTPWTT
jgi:ERCC4-type nuclease